MHGDGNDVDAEFEELIAREFGEHVTAPGRPGPDEPVRRPTPTRPTSAASHPVEEVVPPSDDRTLGADPMVRCHTVTRMGVVLVVAALTTYLLVIGGVQLARVTVVVATGLGLLGAGMLVWRGLTRGNRDDHGPWGNDARL